MKSDSSEVVALGQALGAKSWARGRRVRFMMAFLAALRMRFPDGDRPCKAMCTDFTGVSILDCISSELRFGWSALSLSLASHAQRTWWHPAVTVFLSVPFRR